MVSIIRKTLNRIIHLKISRVIYIKFNNNKLAQVILRLYSNHQAEKLVGKSGLHLISLRTINSVNQGTHPDALISNEVVPGEIVMTVSGYPFNIAKYENQYIFKSKDGLDFQNLFCDRAIATYDGNGLSHYSDGNIIEYNHRIYLYYRMCYNDCADPFVVIYQRNTSDLINWSEETQIATGYKRDGIKFISPTIVDVHENFYMYYVEMDKKNKYRFMMRKSNTLEFREYKDIKLKINNEPEGKNIWHIDVAKKDEDFYGLFVYAEGYGGHCARLYEAYSADGINWYVGEEIKLDLNYKYVSRIYRATMIPREEKWDLYIPVRNDKLCWFILLSRNYVFSFDKKQIKRGV